MMLLTLKSYFNAYKIRYHQLKFSGLSYLLYCNNLRQVMFKPLHRTEQGFYTQPGSVQYLYEVGHTYTEQGFQSRTPSYTEQGIQSKHLAIYRVGHSEQATQLYGVGHSEQDTWLYGVGIWSRTPSYMEQSIQSRAPGYTEYGIWGRTPSYMEQGIRSKTPAYTEQDTQLYGLGYMVVMTGT